MLPAQLVAEVEALSADGFAVSLTEESGWGLVAFEDYSLPQGYSRGSTLLVIKVPVSYPNGSPDMFWTEVDVLRADGSTPKSADTIEEFAGRKWRRFSWHPQGWNPGVDSLETYLAFVDTGLAKAKLP